ncbi:hypothetical protein HDU81_000313 [Chytriomyces hyalinus]|nr:hypothetical protein HDU81_000313 [Chytriomyces hyalinus]
MSNAIGSKRSLHRSHSLVTRKNEASGLTSRVASTMSAGSRRGSSEELGWYGIFSQEDIDALAVAAIQRLRALFVLHGFKPLVTPDILKQLQENCGYIPPKKKWWKWKKPVKEDKDKNDKVMTVALCKSIEYASMACENESTFNLRRIPILAYECINFLKANGLKSNGIFRVNGSERRMAQLATVFDAGPKYGLGFAFEGYTVYDVADFLKRYIRGLPEPLLTTELYPFFLKCLEVPVEGGARIKAFRWLIMLLPPSHLILLEQMLELFSMVAGFSETNQMTSNNLARIFSPNILKPKSDKQALEEFQSCSFVVEFMIENVDQFSITSRDVRPFEILDTSYMAKKPRKETKVNTSAAASNASMGVTSTAGPPPSQSIDAPPLPSQAPQTDPSVAVDRKLSF